MNAVISKSSRYKCLLAKFGSGIFCVRRQETWTLKLDLLQMKLIEHRYEGQIQTCTGETETLKA